MTELTTGELADAMKLTFAAFWARLNRPGARDQPGIDALNNFLSEELDKEARLKAQEKAAGMAENGDSRIGTEA